MADHFADLLKIADSGLPWSNPSGHPLCLNTRSGILYDIYKMDIENFVEHKIHIYNTMSPYYPYRAYCMYDDPRFITSIRQFLNTQNDNLMEQYCKKCTKHPKFQLDLLATIKL